MKYFCIVAFKPLYMLLVRNMKHNETAMFHLKKKYPKSNLLVVLSFCVEVLYNIINLFYSVFITRFFKLKYIYCSTIPYHLYL